jgi:hypothetical protein
MIELQEPENSLLRRAIGRSIRGMGGAALAIGAIVSLKVHLLDQRWIS